MAEQDIVTTPEAAPSATVSALGSQGMREFVRYFVSSALALVVDVGALFVLTSVLSVPYLYSGAVAFLAGLMVIYLLSIYWVFERRTVRNPAAEFIVFAVIGVVGLGINEAMLYTLTGLAGFYYLVSKIGSVCVVFAWNFLARKYLLF
jgi:putative flippase GtrA